jgi:hypothetical protein
VCLLDFHVICGVGTKDLEGEIALLIRLAGVICGKSAVRVGLVMLRIK